MNRFLATSRRLAFGVAAIALVASWTASGARANIAYAYAEETITLTSVPTSVTVTDASPLSQTTANLNNINAGSGTVNAFDAPQSSIGPAPPEPPGNFFMKFATFTPAVPGPNQLPSGPPSIIGPPPMSFARGDVLLDPVARSGSAVSEVYLSGPGQRGGGDGNNHITYTFTTNGTAGDRSIGYSFSNEVFASANQAPPDTANGSFSFGVQLIGPTGANIPVTGIDPLTTGTLSAKQHSGDITHSGTGTLLLAGLLANTTYTITFSLDANTNATTGVPEPATMAMVLTALPLLGLGLLRRRNRKAQA